MRRTIFPCLSSLALGVGLTALAFFVLSRPASDEITAADVAWATGWKFWTIDLRQEPDDQEVGLVVLDADGTVVDESSDISLDVHRQLSGDSKIVVALRPDRREVEGRLRWAGGSHFFDFDEHLDGTVSSSISEPTKVDGLYHLFARGEREFRRKGATFTDGSVRIALRVRTAAEDE
ncbi:hypothetical protein [Alienimonas sp. DA493]|uniref:hypothetical protein n=1 Tax=Alienimonas sp. DA493 TaxID=3373605 RepID=UPI0037543AE2